MRVGGIRPWVSAEVTAPRDAVLLPVVNVEVPVVRRGKGWRERARERRRRRRGGGRREGGSGGGGGQV